MSVQRRSLRHKNGREALPSLSGCRDTWLLLTRVLTGRKTRLDDGLRILSARPLNMTQSRSMPNNLQIRVAVEEEVETWIQTCDAEQLLRNREYDAILLGVTDEVMNNRLVPEMRPTMNDADRAFIQGQVNHLVHQCLAKPRKSRFERFDRVVCKMRRRGRLGARLDSGSGRGRSAGPDRKAAVRRQARPTGWTFDLGAAR